MDSPISIKEENDDSNYYEMDSPISIKEENDDSNYYDIKNQLIVYTTRIDDMQIVKGVSKELNAKHIFQMIESESKPCFHFQNKIKIFNEPRYNSYKLLCRKLDKIKQLIKYTPYPKRSIDNIGTKELTVVLTDIIKREPHKDHLKARSKTEMQSHSQSTSNPLCSNEGISTLQDTLEIPEMKNDNSNNILLIFSNIYSATTEIYIINEVGNIITNYVYINLHEYCNNISTGENFKQTFLKNNCCWYRRNLKIVNLWPKYINSATLKKMTEDLHMCPNTECSCCCKIRYESEDNESSNNEKNISLETLKESVSEIESKEQEFSLIGNHQLSNCNSKSLSNEHCAKKFEHSKDLLSNNQLFKEKMIPASKTETSDPQKILVKEEVINIESSDSEPEVTVASNEIKVRASSAPVISVKPIAKLLPQNPGTSALLIPMRSEEKNSVDCLPKILPKTSETSDVPMKKEETTYHYQRYSHKAKTLEISELKDDNSKNILLLLKNSFQSLTEFFIINEKGQILANRRFYKVQKFDKITKGNFKTKIEKSNCCWYKRKHNVKNLCPKYINDASFKILIDEPHPCLSLACNCCCRAENNVKDKKVEKSRVVPIKELKENKPIETKILPKIETPVTQSPNKSSLFNGITKLIDDKTLDSVEVKTENNTLKPENKASVNISSDVVANNILEKFQNVSLTINNDGKVSALLRCSLDTLSESEKKVLSKILEHAQTQVEELNLTYADKCFRSEINSNNKSINELSASNVKNVNDSKNQILQNILPKPYDKDKSYPVKSFFIKNTENDKCDFKNKTQHVLFSSKEGVNKNSQIKNKKQLKELKILSGKTSLSNDPKDASLQYETFHVRLADEGWCDSPLLQSEGVVFESRIDNANKKPALKTYGKRKFPTPNSQSSCSNKTPSSVSSSTVSHPKIKIDDKSSNFKSSSDHRVETERATPSFQDTDYEFIDDVKIEIEEHDLDLTPALGLEDTSNILDPLNNSPIDVGLNNLIHNNNDLTLQVFYSGSDDVNILGN